MQLSGNVSGFGDLILDACTQQDGLDPDLERIALVAQWIEHQTSNLGVAGSSPGRGISFWASSVLVV